MGLRRIQAHPQPPARAVDPAVFDRADRLLIAAPDALTRLAQLRQRPLVHLRQGIDARQKGGDFRGDGHAGEAA
jgi:hypothetical protein